MNIICPKCHEVIYVPDGKSDVICCGEVIYVFNDNPNNIKLDDEKIMKEAFKSIKYLLEKNKYATHSSKNETNIDGFRRKSKKNCFKWLRIFGLR